MSINVVDSKNFVRKLEHCNRNEYFFIRAIKTVCGVVTKIFNYLVKMICSCYYYGFSRKISLQKVSEKQSNDSVYKRCKLIGKCILGAFFIGSVIYGGYSFSDKIVQYINGINYKPSLAIDVKNPESSPLVTPQKNDEISMVNKKDTQDFQCLPGMDRYCLYKQYSKQIEQNYIDNISSNSYLKKINSKTTLMNESDLIPNTTLAGNVSKIEQNFIDNISSSSYLEKPIPKTTLVNESDLIPNTTLAGNASKIEQNSIDNISSSSYLEKPISKTTLMNESDLISNATLAGNVSKIEQNSIDNISSSSYLEKPTSETTLMNESDLISNATLAGNVSKFEN